MVLREKFEQDLNELSDKVVALGKLAEEALLKSFLAFETQNTDLALKVLENDKKINLLEEEINDFAILLVAKQQPVAIDLRRIIVSIKIAADIERMADYGVNIAKATIRIGRESHILQLTDLKKMHEIMIQMVRLSFVAYSEEDIQSAKDIANMDDEVDSLYNEFVKVLLEEAGNNLPQFNHISFVARQVERAADHATNVAENIYYVVRGRHLDLNK